MTEIALEPFAIGATVEDDDRLRTEEELRAQLAGISVPQPQSLSSQAQALGSEVQAPQSQRAALERMAADADGVGAAYRAQQRPDPRRQALEAAMRRIGNAAPLPPTPYAANAPMPAREPAPPPDAPSVRDALPAVDALASRLQNSAPDGPSSVPPAQDRRAQGLEMAKRRLEAPSAPDYTGADIGDAIRRPFHGIGNALRAAAGSSPIAFRSEGEAARARDARTAVEEQRAAQQASEDRMSEREMALRERNADSLDADRTERNSRLRLQANNVAQHRTEMAQIARMRAEGQLTEDQAQAAFAQSRQRLLEAEADPESRASQLARQQYGGEIALREAASGQDLPDAPEGLAAENYAGMSQTLRSTRQVRQPRAGSGGGADSQALDTPPEGWRGTPEQWAALPRSQRQRAVGTLGTRALRRGEIDDGRQWTPRGWVDRDHRELDPIQRRRVQDAGADSARLVGQLRRLEELSREVSAMERAGGTLGSISPRLAEARQLHENVIVALRNAGNYGVPTGNEIQRMERLAPSLEDVRTFVNAGRQYGGIISAHNRSMDSWMGGLGVEREGAQQSAQAGARQQQAQASANEAARGAQTGDVIFVYEVNGQPRRRRVRAENVERARAAMGDIEFTEEPTDG